ncbi:hypothetical protein [Catenulispora acidiphila]|uniref:hypothetical protein n=1 Tax=Catenulispora acidiphila TaxID=304895 RepID=UPI00117DBE6A|nr:hypothetical protein [Catenulispora acidiphila]
MTGRFRRRLIRILKGAFWAFAEGSGARVQLALYQHPVGCACDADRKPEAEPAATPGPTPAPALAPVPAWHPERIVPLSDLPAAEQRWWRSLEEHLR